MNTRTHIQQVDEHFVQPRFGLLPERIKLSSARVYFTAAIVLVLLSIPLASYFVGHTYYTTMFARILIYGIAVVGLNVLIGYAGLISFGHALYLGIGVYAVAILQAHGITDGWTQLAVALAASLLISFVTGLICLRTNGMGFIMITLAFAQMFYFLAVSLEAYGGDDGMRLDTRSQFGAIDFSNLTQLYWVAFILLLLTMYLSWRLVHSRFGYIIRGIKSNERRVRALGLSATKFKLVVFIWSACVTTLAGFLLVNLTNYASPSYMSWQVSGELIVMIVIGGLATIVGPLIGVIALVMIEDFLTGSSVGLISEHWMLLLGVAIIVIVLFAKKGLYGTLYGRAQKMNLLSGKENA